MARIGIFGGSFNPPHLGHMLAVREFYEKLDLDRVLLIPAAQPPHKQLAEGSAEPSHRLRMTELAAQALPYVEVLDMELRRAGKSYTADTVDELCRLFPRDEIFLLMGTDMFLSFDRWCEAERIAGKVTLAVAHRSTDRREQLSAWARHLAEIMGAKTVLVENSFLPYSSTGVRALLAFGCAEEFLNPAVMDYITRNDLYGVHTPRKNLPFEDLRRESLRLHRPERVNHVIGCSETAEELALRWGADPVAAKRAGILHDVTKALNAGEQLHLCKKYDIVLNQFEAQHPKLLHAKTGAAMAEKVFGERPEVVNAICWHTTGRADMTLLDKVLYLADYMEPNRDIPGVEVLRELAQTDLDRAVLQGLRMTMDHLERQGSEVDPNSVGALCFLQERIDSR